MTTQRQKGLHSGLRSKKRPVGETYPARWFPVQHEIQKLEARVVRFSAFAILVTPCLSLAIDGGVESKCNRFCATDR